MLCHDLVECLVIFPSCIMFILYYIALLHPCFVLCFMILHMSFYCICIMRIMPWFASWNLVVWSSVTPLFFLSPPHSCNMLIPATIHQVHPSFYSIQTSPFFFIRFNFMWHFPCPENVPSFPANPTPCRLPLCQFSALLDLIWLESKLPQVWI